jgi:hypothetical protein
MNWDAQKMHDKKENKMRIGNNSFDRDCIKKFGTSTGLGAALQYKYSDSSNPSPIERELSTGEKVTEDLVELAKFAEEVADFISARTARIVKPEPAECCSAETMKSPYYPEYFQILINQTNRIRDALYRIRATGESIDL